MCSVVLCRACRRACRFRVPAIVVAAAVMACGGPARVRLVPLGGDCGQPPGGQTVVITAYTATGKRSQQISVNDSVSIADFPADTEQIGVEVMIGNLVVGAAGKSAPLAFGALADGATIPVLMAPLGGFCEVGALTEARTQPLVARAGDGALVVGGVGPGGPLTSAEYYDPDTATFSAIELPRQFLAAPQGFDGSALTALPDGRVVLSGGPYGVLAVFDPERRAFEADVLTIDPRALHAAIATSDHEVMLAGGCTSSVAGMCAGLRRRQIQRYDLTKQGTPDPSAVLSETNNLRVGAQLFDLGTQLDGARRFLLAGGTGDPGLADRFALGDELVTTLDRGQTQAVALDGGAVLSAFGRDDVVPPTDGVPVVVLPPGGLAVETVANAPSARRVRLVALEDGRIAGFGGDTMGRVMTYDPTRDAWQLDSAPSPAQTGELSAPSLVRLGDGSVLVLGGSMVSRAWVYRPSLVGPASDSVTAAPSMAAAQGVLIASDPATVTRVISAPPAWQLTVPADAQLARALVGGPRTASGSIVAAVHDVVGGVALIAQQTGPGEAIVAELTPGQPAQLVRFGGGDQRALCTASSALAPFAPSGPALVLAIDERAVRVTVDGSEALTCTLTETARGAWGIASLGAGAHLVIGTVTVAR